MPGKKKKVTMKDLNVRAVLVNADKVAARLMPWRAKNKAKKCMPPLNHNEAKRRGHRL